MAETFRKAAVKNKDSVSILKKWRWTELVFLTMAAAIVGFGLFLVYQAKTSRPMLTPELSDNEKLSAILADDPEKVSFAEYGDLIEKQKIVNVNNVREPKDILPFLNSIENEDERVFIAQKIIEIVKQNRLSSVSGLSSSKSAITTRGEIAKNPKLEFLNEVLSKVRLNSRDPNSEIEPENSADTDTPFNILRPFMSELRNQLVVRNPAEFKNDFLLWSLTFFGAFFVVHILWSVFGFDSDEFLLPIVFILCGLGFILMTTIHDPLRDSLSFAEFAKGGLVGVLILLAVSFSEKIISRFSVRFRHLMQIFEGKKKWIPLGVALLLSVLLLTIGNGPGGTKVNLFSMQPSEFIKILAVFFFAAYFAEKSSYLQNLKLGLIRKFPRLIDFVPVVLAVGIVFVLFFRQKDLGPALIIIFTFLILYAVARKKVFLMLLGFVLFCSLLAFSFYFAEPMTVYERVMIWQNVWENGLARGDQIARGMWALASGGFYGTGLGLGDPSENTIPAGHTDLVLASIGEEIGFVGVAFILVLYCVLILRFLKISLNARRDASFFLGLGLTLLFAVQIALIASGVLGLFPLTGVVNPFLSWGKSSMIANFIILGFMALISADSPKESSNPNFSFPVKTIGVVFVLLVSVFVIQAYRIQSWNGDENAAKGILTKQRDGEYRYIYNPRLLEVARLLPKGTIYDINGIPLATSDCQKLVEHKSDYEKLGYLLDENCAEGKRQYPFYREEGLSLFHLLGDARSRKNWEGRNRYIEREQELTLQGFNDSSKNFKPEDKLKIVYEFDKDKNQVPVEVKVTPRDLSEVVPLLRYRHFTWQPDLQKLWNKPRDVKTTIDVRLQIETARIVEKTIKDKKLKKAAAVVIDPTNGNVLASVSYPWFSENQLNEFIENPAKAESNVSPAEKEQTEMRLADRVRLEDYPPGSTFKILTSIAALKNNPQVFDKIYKCERLPDGRAGFKLPGFGRPIRDDEDDQPHDDVDMKEGIIKSCNAYFAQLGVDEVKDSGLWETSKMMGIQFTQNPLIKYEIKGKEVEVNFQTELKNGLPQATFGQYPVKATPFQMAEVAATIANQGTLFEGRWLLDQPSANPVKFIEPASSQIIADAMRGVVTDGTATGLKSIPVEIAGKTGTAEVPNKDSHSWFIGFAPYRGTKKLAFAVLFENGGYGSVAAAPAAGRIVEEAFRLKILE